MKTGQKRENVVGGCPTWPATLPEDQGGLHQEAFPGKKKTTPASQSGGPGGKRKEGPGIVSMGEERTPTKKWGREIRTFSFNRLCRAGKKLDAPKTNHRGGRGVPSKFFFKSSHRDCLEVMENMGTSGGNRGKKQKAN